MKAILAGILASCSVANAIDIRTGFETYRNPEDNDLANHFTIPIGACIQESTGGFQDGRVRFHRASELLFRPAIGLSPGAIIDVSVDFQPFAKTDYAGAPYYCAIGLLPSSDVTTIPLVDVAVSNPGHPPFHPEFYIIESGTNTLVKAPSAVAVWNRLQLRLELGRTNNEVKINTTLAAIATNIPPFITARHEQTYRLPPFFDRRSAYLRLNVGHSFSIDNFSCKAPDAEILKSAIAPAAELIWQSTTGRHYRIERRFDLVGSAWVSVAGPISGTGGEMSHLISTREFPLAFYRIQEE